MKAPDDRDQCTLEDVSSSDQFARFLSDSPSGVLLVPTSPTGEPPGDLAFASETYPFAKWVRKNHPEIPLNVTEPYLHRELRSGDIWLPLAFLATDVTLPIFLNLIANYLYDRLRGRLHHDAPTVHLEVQFTDRSMTKRFFYKGSVAGLQASIKKLDLNAIMKPPNA